MFTAETFTSFNHDLLFPTQGLSREKRGKTGDRPAAMYLNPHVSFNGFPWLEIIGKSLSKSGLG